MAKKKRPTKRKTATPAADPVHLLLRLLSTVAVRGRDCSGDDAKKIADALKALKA